MEEQRPAPKRKPRTKHAVPAGSSVPVRRVDPSTTKATLYPWKQTIALLTQLARDRGRERDSDLARQALYIGSLFVCILDGPGDDGLYGGLYTPIQVANQIRSYVSNGADWLASQGQPVTAGASGFASLLAMFNQHPGQQQIDKPIGYDDGPFYSEEELAGAGGIMPSDQMDIGLGDEELGAL